MEELRNKLFSIVNEANSLPPEAIYYVCKDFFREVQDSYNVYLTNKARQEAQDKLGPDVAEEENIDGE